MEHTYILGLDEIKAIRFRCQKCQTSTSFRLNESVALPAICPGCRSMLYDKTLDTGDDGVVHALPRVLKSLQELQDRKKAFEMLLEIDAPRR